MSKSGLALLVADLDRLDRRVGRGFRLRRHGRDRLAEVAHLVVGEQRLVGRDAEALEMAVDVLRDVRVRDDRAHALHRLGLARVERADRRVVVRRAERLHPERLADADVVDELGAARDVPEAVVAGEPCADGLHAGLPFGRTSGSPASRQRQVVDRIDLAARRGDDGLDDLHVAGAAAVVAAERLQHVVAVDRAARALDQRRRSR